MARMALQLLAIVACGVAGALAGWAVVQFFEAPAIVEAIVAAVIGMVAAFGAWVGLVAVRDALARRGARSAPGGDAR